MRELKRGYFKIVTEGATVVADTRFFPIVPADWRGDSSPRTYDLFWQFRNEHLVDRVKKVVFVHKIDDADPPSATTRKHLADISKADPRLQVNNVEFMQVFVVSNPLLRGVLTAVNWMTGKESMPMEYQPNLNAGIIAAKRILDQAGVTYPDIDPTKYKIPTPAELNVNDIIATYGSS